MMWYILLFGVEEKIPKTIRRHCKKFAEYGMGLSVHENSLKSLETLSQQFYWSFSSEGGKSIKWQYTKKSIPEINKISENCHRIKKHTDS